MSWSVAHRDDAGARELAAMLDTTVGGAGRVTFHALDAVADHGPARQAAAAEAGRAILALEQDWATWILEPDADHCVGCFLMWRLHAWSGSLTAAAHAGSSRSVGPLADALVRAQIVAFARRPARQPGGSSVVRLVVTGEGLASDHAIIRHPNCACAPLDPVSPEDVAERAPRAGLRGSTLARISATIVPLVHDRRLGAIRTVARNRDLAFASSASATMYPFRHPHLVEKGFGRTGRQGDDPVIAVVETLERFAGMQPRGRGAIVSGSFADLHDRAIDPERFILHAPGQRDEPGFALSAYDPDRPYRWVPAYSFRRDAQVLVPMQLAYYDRGGKADPADRTFVFEVSNGCAAGASLAEAALHGLFETVERDAFLGTWHANRAVRRIDVATCPSPYLHAMAARLGAEGLVADAYDLSTGETAIRSMAVRIRDPDLRFGPAALYGAGAHIDAASALEAAMAEAVTNVRLHSDDTRRKATERGLHLLAHPDDVRTMDDHQLQCWPIEALGTRGFVEEAGAAMDWDAVASPRPDSDAIDIGDLLSSLARRLMDRCADVLVVDQSFDPIAGRGLRFAKVLVPGLLPMTFGQQYRRLSQERLATFAAGGAPRPTWRTDPHVFP